MELQELKDRYPHLRNSPHQSYNLNDVQVTRLLQHSPPFRNQEIRRQSRTMGSEIKDRLGLKWSATSEAGSNSCHNSNINCRRQTSKTVEWVVGYRVLRPKLQFHSTFKGSATSNEDVAANNAIQLWKIWSRISVARGRSEVAKELLLCIGATQVSWMAPPERQTLRKRYQETIDTDVNAGYVRKVDQAELKETKNKLQWFFPHHPVINPHKPLRKSERYATQKQSIKA